MAMISILKQYQFVQGKDTKVSKCYVVNKQVSYTYMMGNVIIVMMSDVTIIMMMVMMATTFNSIDYAS